MEPVVVNRLISLVFNIYVPSLREAIALQRDGLHLNGVFHNGGRGRCCRCICYRMACWTSVCVNEHFSVQFIKHLWVLRIGII